MLEVARKWAASGAVGAATGSTKPPIGRSGAMAEQPRSRRPSPTCARPGGPRPVRHPIEGRSPSWGTRAPGGHRRRYAPDSRGPRLRDTRHNRWTNRRGSPRFRWRGPARLSVLTQLFEGSWVHTATPLHSRRGGGSSPTAQPCTTSHYHPQGECQSNLSSPLPSPRRCGPRTSRRPGFYAPGRWGSVAALRRRSAPPPTHPPHPLATHPRKPPAQQSTILWPNTHQEPPPPGRRLPARVAGGPRQPPARAGCSLNAGTNSRAHRDDVPKPPPQPPTQKTTQTPPQHPQLTPPPTHHQHPTKNTKHRDNRPARTSAGPHKAPAWRPE